MMRISDGNKKRLETVKRLNDMKSFDDVITLLFNNRDPVEFYLHSWLLELGVEMALPTDDVYKIYLYTDKNRYYIVAKRDGSYFGCQWSPLDSLPDEGGRGGGDLSDGVFCHETWENIKSDILRLEILHSTYLERAE